MDAVSSALAVPTLSVDTLVELLRVSGPTNPLTVRGVLGKLTYWPKEGPYLHIYASLSQGEASIRVRLPATTEVHESEAVVMHGTLRIKPTKESRQAWEVTLIGDVVGKWTPCDVGGVNRPAKLSRDRPLRALATVIEDDGVSSLAFLSTGTAWRDFAKAAESLEGLIKNCLRPSVNFSDEGTLLEVLASFKDNPKISAIVITRGGGGGLETLGDSRSLTAALLACGKPFYTALGHDQDIHVMDRFADQAFPTPSLLGTALVAIVDSMAEMRTQADLECELREREEELEDQLNRAHERIKMLTAAAVKIPQVSRYELAKIKIRQFLIYAALVGAGALLYMLYMLFS